MATPQPDATCDTATVILDAAQARLLEFGYHKTTMAEIAADCGMSAANLYRYFANKEEIAAECATRCMNERLERLRPIVEDASTSAADKLLAYALMLVEDSHALAGSESRIGELVATITHQRPAGATLSAFGGTIGARSIRPFPARVASANRFSRGRGRSFHQSHSSLKGSGGQRS